MAPWLRVLESYLIAALLRTPAFHRGVEKVAHRVHRFRSGLPPDPQGGTSVDDPSQSNFFKHFSEEVQTQLGRAERRTEGQRERKRRVIPEEGENAEAAWRAESEERVVRESGGRERTEAKEGASEDAEGAWREAGKRGYEEGKGPAPQAGFLREYMGALREQMRGGKGG